MALDHEPLKAMHAVDLSALSKADRIAARMEASARIEAISGNYLDRCVPGPTEGGFSSRDYGQVASTAAFLVVQHADTACIIGSSPLEAMADRGEALKWQYAMVFDRIAVAEG